MALLALVASVAQRTGAASRAVAGGVLASGMLAGLVLAGLVLASPPARADAALAAQKNCLGCHHAVQRRAGPSLQAIAQRYNAIADPKARAAAIDGLAAKVRSGGRGSWGVVPMPANPQVSEVDARKIVAWMLEAHR